MYAHLCLLQLAPHRLLYATTAQVIPPAANEPKRLLLLDWHLS